MIPKGTKMGTVVYASRVFPPFYEKHRLVKVCDKIKGLDIGRMVDVMSIGVPKREYSMHESNFFLTVREARQAARRTMMKRRDEIDNTIAEVTRLIEDSGSRKKVARNAR